MVLARELSLEQIRAISAQTSTTLEFFVHGALCVSYSGQCYISHAHTGRSANRGECAQLCRLPWSLEDATGRVLERNKHLLSLKDMNQSSNLDALIDAGITSFKIEGRLKDLAYVKNVTAHYRQALDKILDARPELGRASSGHCSYTFTPQPEKSFNRGATDYFLHGRQPDIASWRSPKFIGTEIGTVASLNRQSLTFKGMTTIANGDGLCFFDRQEQLVGFRINRADGAELFPGEMPQGLEVGTVLYRNGDRAFDKQLEKTTASRRIPIDLSFSETAQGFALTLEDEDGLRARVTLDHEKTPAQKPEQAHAAIHDALSKLGNTIFAARKLQITLSAPYFIAASTLNALRRSAVEQLENARLSAYQRPAKQQPQVASFPVSELGYLGNVANRLARAFYRKHGVERIDDAYECNHETGEVSLMITRHCLRYSMGQCPKETRSALKGVLTLVGDKQQRLRLRFDCKRCEMHVVGQLKPR